MPTACLHRVDLVLVSHAHVDHFYGFDWLLRTALGTRRTVRVAGPPGLADHVEGKLRGYRWNIRMDAPLLFRVLEVREDRVVETRLGLGEPGGPTREPGERRTGSPPPRSPDDPPLVRDPSFEVRHAILDHGGIPSVAYRFRPTASVTVDEEALASRLGVEPGPWLAVVRRGVREGRPDDHGIEVGGERVRLGDLRGEATLRWDPGIAWVGDASPDEENRARAAGLARGARTLYAAAPFTEEERDRARETGHLTAADAARIAREAGVEELCLVHASSRYRGAYGALVEEATAIFEPVRFEERGPPEIA